MDSKLEAILPPQTTRFPGVGPQRSVRVFLIWLVLACLVPGLIGAALLLFHGYRAGRTQLEKNTILTARALVQTVDSHLLRAQTVAQSLSTAGSVYKRHFPDFHRRARELLALTAPGTNFVLIDESGRQIVNTLHEFGAPLPHNGNPAQIRRVFATGKPAISDLFFGTGTQHPFVSIDVPVVIDGKVAYVLSICIQPDHFNSILQAQDLPRDWIAAIFDSSGTIVARAHASEQFVGRKPSAELTKRIFELPEDVIETVTPDGMPVLSVYSRSRVTGWTVAFGIPRQNLESEFMRPLSLLALGMFILFSIGLGLARFMGTRIAHSVRALTGPAMALGAGEAVSAPHVHIKEAAEVANAMREAAELLQKRTAALHETNQLLMARESELTEAHRLAKFGNWYWDLKTDKVTYSESLYEITGRDSFPSFPEMKGVMLTVDSWERVKSASQEAVRAGVGYELELQVLHASGTILWVNSICEVVRDRSGQIVALRGTVQDISERKAAETTLESERETHRMHLEQQVAERTVALTVANQDLERLARQDALTGLQNRLSANERLRNEFLRLKRTARAYAALLIDIDHFKQINDTYGHETGDHVLQQIATVLQGAVRATDFLARFGGEEFLVILPETDIEGALTSAEKIRKTVADQAFPTAGRVTLSIGVACARIEDMNADDAVRRADDALYRSKAEGRNRVTRA